MNSNKKVALQPKGLYCCEKCSNKVQLFIRVAEVVCNQHGQMRKVGK